MCRNTKISQYIIKTLASERITITEGKRNEKRLDRRPRKKEIRTKNDQLRALNEEEREIGKACLDQKEGEKQKAREEAVN